MAERMEQGQRAMLQINVARMAEGEHEYPFSVEPADIGLGPEFKAPVKVHAFVERTGRQYLLTADFSTAVGRECDRCLVAFDKEIEGSYQILYITDPGSLRSKEDDEEVQILPPDAQAIVLDEDLRQFIALEVPGKAVCREECKGLCPSCGRNLNDGSCSCDTSVPDPRWDALKNLTKRTTSH